MKITRIILFIATLMSCTTEKDIIWGEFEVNGLSGNPNMEFRDPSRRICNPPFSEY